MKHFLALTCAALLALPASAQTVKFGNNTSEWARDGECDDRRFTGAGVDTELDNDDIMHDAADCRAAYNAGTIRLIDPVAAKAATVCSKINFGSDRGEWSKDGECDDYRFEGTGMSSVISVDDIKKDATDCRRLCNAGLLYLRDP